MEKELEESKYKAENDLQVLVEEQTKFNTSTSHSSQDLIRMNMVDASITKTKKDLQDLAKEQEIVQMKASLMTQELRLEELEGSKTELEKALQTCVEKQKYLEMKAYLLSLREKVRSGIILTPFTCLKKSAIALLEQGNKKISMMSAQLHAQIDEHAVTSTNLTPVYGTETSTPKMCTRLDVQPDDEPGVVMLMTVNLSAEYADQTSTSR
ncbi:hypothetical protein ACET3Z_014042 [Daucus carota]